MTEQKYIVYKMSKKNKYKYVANESILTKNVIDYFTNKKEDAIALPYDKACMIRNTLNRGREDKYMLWLIQKVKK